MSAICSVVLYCEYGGIITLYLAYSTVSIIYIVVLQYNDVNNLRQTLKSNESHGPGLKF